MRYDSSDNILACQYWYNYIYYTSHNFLFNPTLVMYTIQLHGELMYADLEIEVKLKTSSVGFKKGKLKKHEAACAVQYTAVAGSQVPQHHNSEDDKINFSGHYS